MALALPLVTVLFVTFFVLFIVAMTVWRGPYVPHIYLQHSESSSTVTLDKAYQTVDITVVNPNGNLNQNFYFSSYGSDPLDSYPANGVSCQNLKNILPSTTSNSFRTCNFETNSATSFSLRIQFPIPVSTFEWRMND